MSRSAVVVRAVVVLGAAVVASVAPAFVVITLPPSGPMVPRVVLVPELAGDPDHGDPLAVSGDGTVIVGNGISPSGPEAFRWTPTGGAVGLGDLPGGEHRSDALLASPDGAVVVGISATDRGREPFRWTAATGMQPLAPDDEDWAGCIPAVASEALDTLFFSCSRFPYPDFRPPFLMRSDGAIELIPIAVSDLDHDADVAVGSRWFSPNERAATRVEAGSDGRFGTDDDETHDLLVVSDPDATIDPVHLSRDGRVAAINVQKGYRIGSAYRWDIGPDDVAGTDDDSLQDISTRSGGRARCATSGLSDDGAVLWGHCQVMASGRGYPARWTASGGWAHLAARLPAGTLSGGVGAGSSDGSVLTGVLTLSSGTPGIQISRLFRWTARSGLSLFAVENTWDDDAELSSNGNHVVGIQKAPSGRGFGVFLWSVGKGRRYVGDIPDGPSATRAYGLSADGTVIAAAGRSMTGYQAFRWVEGESALAVGGGQPYPRAAKLSRDGRVLLSLRDPDEVYDPVAPSEGPVLRRATGEVTKTFAQPRPYPQCAVRGLSPDGRTLFGGCSSNLGRTPFSSAASGIATSLRRLPNPTGFPDAECWIEDASANGAAVVLVCRVFGYRDSIHHYDVVSRRSVALGDPRSEGAAVIGISDDGSRVAGASYAPDDGVFLWSKGVGETRSPYRPSFTPVFLTRDGTSVIGRDGNVLVRWRPETGYEDLAPPDDAVAADGIERLLVATPDGRVLAASARRAGDPAGVDLEVFVHSPTSGSWWLRDLLEDLHVEHAERAVGEVVAISDDGTRILGQHRDHLMGTSEAWLVVLPTTVLE